MKRLTRERIARRFVCYKGGLWAAAAIPNLFCFGGKNGTGHGKDMHANWIGTEGQHSNLELDFGILVGWNLEIPTTDANLSLADLLLLLMSCGRSGLWLRGG